MNRQSNPLSHMESDISSPTVIHSTYVSDSAACQLPAQQPAASKQLRPRFPGPPARRRRADRVEIPRAHFPPSHPKLHRTCSAAGLITLVPSPVRLPARPRASLQSVQPTNQGHSATRAMQQFAYLVKGDRLQRRHRRGRRRTAASEPPIRGTR